MGDLPAISKVPILPVPEARPPTTRYLRGRTFGYGTRRICQALLSLVLPVFAHAEQLPIRIYRTADGLAGASVSSIVADKNGYLWFGTSEGLSRFDGYEFTNYGLNEGLPHASVNALLITRDGSLWVGTSRVFAASTRRSCLPGIGSRSISHVPSGTPKSLVHWRRMVTAPAGVGRLQASSACGGSRYFARNLSQWI